MVLVLDGPGSDILGSPESTFLFLAVNLVVVWFDGNGLIAGKSPHQMRCLGLVCDGERAVAEIVGVIRLALDAYAVLAGESALGSVEVGYDGDLGRKGVSKNMGGHGE